MYKWLVILILALIPKLYADDAVDFRHQKIIGVEVLVAGAGSGLESSFGHAFLRLVKEDGAWGDDIVIGFVADPMQKFKSEQELEATSSFKFFSGFLSGEYPLAMQVSSLYDFWSRYVIKEGRSIERKIILSTPESRQKLLIQLEEFVTQTETKLGAYRFFSRNCASMVLELLQHSHFPHPRSSLIKPTSLLNFFENSWNSPYPSLKFVERSETIDLLKKANVREQDSKEVVVEKLSSQLSDLEIKKLLVVGEINGLVLKEMSKRHPFSKGASFDQAVGVSPLPQEVYQYCEDGRCAEEVYRSLIKDQSVRYKRALLRESQHAPKPKETIINNHHSNVKRKMIHIYEANGHEQVIKRHYQLLGDLLRAQ